MPRLIADDTAFMDATLDVVEVEKVKAELGKLQTAIDTQTTWKEVLSVVLNVVGIAKGLT